MSFSVCAPRSLLARVHANFHARILLVRVVVLALVFVCGLVFVLLVIFNIVWLVLGSVLVLIFVASV